MRQLYTYARCDSFQAGRPVDYQMLIEDTKFAASELLVNNFSRRSRKSLARTGR